MTKPFTSFLMSRLAATLLLSFSVASCAWGSRQSMPIADDTLSYTQEVSEARQKQLLLNIVRLRYNDAVSFVDLQTLTTTDRVAVDGRLSSSVALTGTGAIDVISGNSGLSKSTQPTVVYSALRGKSYAEQLLRPLPPASIFLLSQSGWNIEQLMLCCVARLGDINNARTATGPTPDIMPNNDRFQTLARLMRTLQEKNALLVQVIDPTEGERDTRVVVKWWRWPDEGDELAAFLTDHWAVRVEPLVGNRYIAEIKTRGNERGDFAVHGRSLMGVMYALSQTVHVPEAHRDLVPITQGAEPTNGGACEAPGGWNDIAGGYFAVMVSEKEPKSAAIAVEYRDHWFYIDDTCFAAKATLNLVDNLYALQAGIRTDNSTLILLGG